MPKCRFPKLIGNICKIPIYLADMANILSRDADSSDLLIVRIKPKLSYCGHVYFKVVRTNTLQNALSDFKQNSLYHDIAIALGNITENLLSLSDNSIEKSEKVETLEEDGNPLDSLRFNSQETMFLSITSVSDETDIFLEWEDYQYLI